MQYHVCLGFYSAFLPDDLYELTEWERASHWPLSYSYDQSFVLECSRLLRFDQNLWYLVVIRHKNSVVLVKQRS